MSRQPQPPAGPASRFGPTLAAFLLGLPLAAAVLGLFHYGPLRHTPAFRYVEYPAQWAAVVLCGCALGALLGKLIALRREWIACGLDILPRWDGRPVPAGQAADLLASINRQPRGIQATYLGRRIRSILEFLCQRQSASGLDDQIRALADGDSVAQENSFGLIRFITWAIPILGFLGTVLGITGAISGISPEVLEESLEPMMNGLAEAFDSTALALGLTMVVMFLSFLIERQEQALLEMVDQLIDRQLAHRFLRDSVDQAPVLDAVRAGSQALATSVEGLVSRQAELWAQALAEPQRQAERAFTLLEERLTLAVHQALEQTAQAHAERLAALEQHLVQHSTQIVQHLAAVAMAVRDTSQQQQQGLQRIAEGIHGQAAALTKLQEGEQNLIHLQAVLHQNLAALASASSFEDAVHSLTAAIHLFTARLGAPSVRLTPGKAA